MFNKAASRWRRSSVAKTSWPFVLFSFQSNSWLCWLGSVRNMRHNKTTQFSKNICFNHATMEPIGGSTIVLITAPLDAALCTITRFVTEAANMSLCIGLVESTRAFPRSDHGWTIQRTIRCIKGLAVPKGAKNLTVLYVTVGPKC
jgi:hypothetical protein